MRHSPRLQPRIYRFLRENEGVRIASCLALMLALVEAGLTLWLTLPLPILTYVGIALLIPTADEAATKPNQPRRQNARTPLPQERAAFETCGQLQQELRVLALRISDEAVSSSLGSIDRRIGEILEVIAEDNKYEATPSLEELVLKTRNLLASYEVVLRRNLTLAEPVSQIRRSFAVLLDRFDRFWAELNRDVIVNLLVLREIIEEEFGDLPIEPEEGTEPSSSTGSGEIPSRSRYPESESRVEASDRPDEPPIILIEDEVADVSAVIAAAAETVSIASNGHKYTGEGLTTREQEVVLLVAAGRTAQEIGERLYISPRTAEAHIASVCEKFHVKSRTAAAVYAIRHHLIDINDVDLG
jgi:DNA-binding CsgD family transcriptional regulator